MQRIYHNNTPLRFSHYSRKGYAAFASLHKEVVIGHVANYIADQQLAKSGCTEMRSNTTLRENIESSEELEETTEILQLVDNVVSYINNCNNKTSIAAASHAMALAHSAISPNVARLHFFYAYQRPISTKIGHFMAIKQLLR